MLPAPRILFITRSLGGIGGMQTLASSLIHELRHQGVDLTVVAFQGPRIFLPLFFVYACVKACFFSGNTVHLGDALLSPIARVTHVLRPGLRFTCTAHGLDTVYPNKLYQWALRCSLPACTVIAALSEATRVEVLKRGIAPDTATVIHPGIVCEKSHDVHSWSGPPTILLLGRQIKRKGTVWFLSQVFPDLLKVFPALRCTVAGSGPELPAIRRTVESLGLTASVSILGSVNNFDREKLFLSASLLLMPNVAVPGDMEGFGLVLIEAASRGLPVIASKREGMVDALLEGQTGFFFQPENSKDCLRVLSQALLHPLSPVNVANAARTHFSIERTASLYRTHVF